MSQQKKSDNPFVNVHLANSFWEKVDVFGEILCGHVVRGTNDNPKKQLSLGIIIYVAIIGTLGLLLLCAYLKTRQNPHLQNLGAVLGNLLYPLMAILQLVLAIIKILAWPIIGIIHLSFYSPPPPQSTQTTQYSNYCEITNYDPISHLSLDGVSETSFSQKIDDTFAVFYGRRQSPSENPIGFEHYLLIIPILLDFGLKSQNPWVFHISKFLKLLFAPIQYAFSFLLSLLNIALLPIVGIVHLLAQPVVPGQTPVWKSFLSSPMTWLGLATVTVAIGFVIQAANPLIFNQAIGALAVMVPSFLVIGGVMTLICLTYSLLEATTSKAPSGKDEKSTKSTNAVADAFRERIDWIRAYPIFSGIFLAVGITVVLTGIVLSVLYLTGNLLPDTLIGQIIDAVFQFMNSAFTSGIQGLGNLPGLEFFASISAETLATISQVFSALALTLGSFCLLDMMMRFVSTLVRTPVTEIRYATKLCTPETAPQDHPVAMNFVQFGERDDYYEVKNGNLYRVVLTETNKGDTNNKIYEIASASTLMTSENFRPTASVK